MRQRSIVPAPLLGLLLTALLFAPSAGAQGRFITEFSLDRDSVEVPFEYIDHQILITGRLDDHKNLTFLFDTGASAPVIDKALGINGYKLSDSTIQEADGISAAETIWVSDLQVGTENSRASAHNIAALVTDLSQVSRVLGHKVDGIIGIPFCAGFVVEIDYAKRLLHFYNPRTYNLASRVGDNQRSFVFNVTPTNLKRAASTLLVTGQLHDKYDYDFLVDTGFGGYLSVAHAAAQEAGLINASTPRVAALSYGVTRTFRSEKVRANFLMLGPINLSGKVVSVDYRNNDVVGQTGILGNRLLQNFRVTLDYQRKKLLLERVTNKEEADDAETPSFGLVIRTGHGTVLVDTVRKNSPADHAGLKPGDAILSINSHEVSEMSPTEVSERLAAGASTAILMIQPATLPNATQPTPREITLVSVSPLDWK